MQYLILANVSANPSLVEVDGLDSQIQKLYQCTLIKSDLAEIFNKSNNLSIFLDLSTK